MSSVNHANTILTSYSISPLFWCSFTIYGACIISFSYYCDYCSVYQRILKQMIQVLNWLVDTIFSGYFGENRVILLQTVAKWRRIKLCASFSGPFCIYRHGFFAPLTLTLTRWPRDMNLTWIFRTRNCTSKITAAGRVVVSVSTSWSRGGLETYRRLGLVSVSSFYVSCPSL